MYVKRENTQVSVVLMSLEEFVGSVEQEFERQKYFYVGSLLQKALVHRFSVFQLVYANSVGPGAIADGIERVHHLSREKRRCQTKSIASDERTEFDRRHLQHPAATRLRKKEPSTSVGTVLSRT